MKEEKNPFKPEDEVIVCVDTIADLYLGNIHRVDDIISSTHITLYGKSGLYNVKHFTLKAATHVVSKPKIDCYEADGCLWFPTGTNLLSSLAIGTLSKYNIMTKADFDTRYPKPLKLAGYTVEDHGTYIKVGDQSMNKYDIKGFLTIISIIIKHRDAGNSIPSIRVIKTFLNNHFKELGL